MENDDENQGCGGSWLDHGTDPMTLKSKVQLLYTCVLWREPNLNGPFANDQVKFWIDQSLDTQLLPVSIRRVLAVLISYVTGRAFFVCRISELMLKNGYVYIA